MSLYAVIPEYDSGLDVSEAWLADDTKATFKEANTRQQEVRSFGVLVVLKVYALTEVKP